jgi:kynurenine formamidase
MPDWSKGGGIVGRGFLLHYVAYAARPNVQYDPMSRHCITLDVLKDIAKERSLTFRQRDILLVRSGWIKWYKDHSPEERVAKVKNGTEYVGVDGSEEVMEWFWDSHFAAVGGDAIGFEAWPPKLPWCKSQKNISTRDNALDSLISQRHRYPRSCSRFLGHATRRVVGS